MTAHNPNQLLMVKQVCEEYGIGKTMLYELLKSGAIPSKRLGKRGRRIRREDIDNWVMTGMSKFRDPDGGTASDKPDK